MIFAPYRPKVVDSGQNYTYVVYMSQSTVTLGNGNAASAALALAGVSQADVGRALGVSRSVINHRWHGRSSWRLSELERLADQGLITITITPGGKPC